MVEEVPVGGGRFVPRRNAGVSGGAPPGAAHVLPFPVKKKMTICHLVEGVRRQTTRKKDSRLPAAVTRLSTHHTSTPTPT